MNIWTVGLVALVAASAGACVNAFDESAEARPDEVAPRPALTVTRSEPILVRPLSEAETESAPDYVEIELLRNVNPAGIPLYFDLNLQRPGEPPALLGTFAPYPADNVGVYLVALTKTLRSGDRLELGLIVIDSDRSGEIRIELAPLRLINR